MFDGVSRVEKDTRQSQDLSNSPEDPFSSFFPVRYNTIASGSKAQTTFCTRCMTMFSSNWDLEVHTNSGMCTPFTCGDCMLKFQTDTELLEHSQLCIRPRTSKEIPTSVVNARHPHRKRRAAVPVDLPPELEVQFPNVLPITYNARKSGVKDGTTFCTQCLATFNSSWGLLVHARSGKCSLFTCGNCMLKFPTDKEQIEHSRLCIGPKATEESDILDARRRAEKKRRGEERREERGEEEKKRAVSCESVLQDSFLNMSPGYSASKPGSKGGTAFCMQCMAPFNSSRDLVVHTHSGKCTTFTCGGCMLKFQTDQERIEHSRLCRDPMQARRVALPSHEPEYIDPRILIESVRSVIKKEKESSADEDDAPLVSLISKSSRLVQEPVFVKVEVSPKSPKRKFKEENASSDEDVPLAAFVSKYPRPTRSPTITRTRGGGNLSTDDSVDIEGWTSEEDDLPLASLVDAKKTRVQDLEAQTSLGENLLRDLGLCTEERVESHNSPKFRGNYLEIKGSGIDYRQEIVEQSDLEIFQDDDLPSEDLHDEGVSADDLPLGSLVSKGERSLRKKLLGKFTCKICFLSFKNGFFLRRHSILHEKVATNFPCHLCSRTYLRADHRLKHMRISHTKDGFQPCSFCKEVFKTRGELLKHNSTHSKEESYYCKLCDRTFKWHSSFKIHLKWHLNPMAHKCERCGKSFFTPSNKRCHIKSGICLNKFSKTTVGKKEFQCRYCARCFVTYYDRKKHELLEHVETYNGKAKSDSSPITSDPFKCSICGESFKSKLGKVNHELQRKCLNKIRKTRMAVQHKEFHCRHCAKCFGTYYDRKKHELVKHIEKANAKTSSDSSAPTPKPFSCSKCGKGFKSKAGKVKHELYLRCKVEVD